MMRRLEFRQAALSRHNAPDFVLLHGLELLQLRKVSDFVLRVFLEVLALSDFATGQVQTSYAQLASLLDFDRAPQAHASSKPTKRRIGLALQQLEQLRLVLDLDPIRNERLAGLFFRVMPRRRIRPSDGMSVTMSVTGQKPAKQAPARVRAKRTTDERNDERTVDQERFLTPKSPDLSTGERAAKRDPDAARAAMRATRDAITARRGRPSK